MVSASFSYLHTRITSPQLHHFPSENPSNHSFLILCARKMNTCSAINIQPGSGGNRFVQRHIFVPGHFLSQWNGGGVTVWLPSRFGPCVPEVSLEGAKKRSWDETALGVKQGRSHGQRRVSQNTDWSVRLHIRLTIVSRHTLLHFTSLPWYR